MNIVVLAGIPGTGSTTVLNKVLEEVDYVNINYGNVMFDIAHERGLVDSRDEMRKLNPEIQKDVQKKAAERIHEMAQDDDVIIDTHLDRMDIKVVSPEGFSYIIPDNASVINRGKLGDVEIIAFNGQLKPFSSAMEVFIGLIPVNDYVTPGLWKLIITGNNIKNGHIDMWLPTTVTLNSGTGFLKPSSGLTYTIPSTAERVITVGAYDSLRNVVSTFSGRGYLSRTGYDVRVKPDLIAPGENVMINDTTVVSGTSFAVPFCTGAAALLMEWGIVRGNDPYMYGDKLKTYLQRGAKPIEGLDAPSSSQGWGRLCLRNSLPIDGM